jgi:ATP-dependent helicase/nuclease subunit B
MPVTFVIGRAGTGKTHRCLTSIIDAVRSDPLHPPILWLLPRQATFAAERELACNTTTGGYFRVRVLSFEQLGQEILAECGGANVPEITPLGRQMLLGHLLRRHASDLKFFRGVARQPGLASQLDTTFAEFERAGKDPSDFDQLLAASPNDNSDALLDKIHDLRLIYREYTKHLGQERFDQHRRLMQVLACIKSSTQFKTATVYCDSFREFSEYERQMLAALGKACKKVEILLLADPKSPLLRDADILPEEHSLFHPIEIAYRRLRITFRAESVPIDDPPITLKDVHRFETPAMQHVERHALGSAITHVSRDSTGIELLDAPDRAAEVDAAARRIIDLVAAGHRYRDIAVLTRDLSAYADLIERSFREHNLPFFTDRRRSMSHHPLLRFIRSLLAIARANWPHEPLMDLLKTDLTGLTFEQISELENYVLRHRIRADAWPATDPWTYGDAGPLASDDPATPAISPSQPIDQRRRQLVDRITPFTPSRCRHRPFQTFRPIRHPPNARLLDHPSRIHQPPRRNGRAPAGLGRDRQTLRRNGRPAR